MSEIAERKSHGKKVHGQAYDFLGITFLIIICNLRIISHYSSTKERINPKNYWDWESQLEDGNLSRLVIERPKSLMSGSEFCKETHNFYSILRVKRAQLYLSPGIPNIEGVCPDPNLEIASISIATCCLIYSVIIMVVVGTSKSDFSVFGLLAFLNVVGLFVSAVIISTCSSMQEAVNNALEQEQIVMDDAGDTIAGVSIAEKAPAPLDHPDHFLHIFEDKQDDQMERNNSGFSHTSISISIGKVESSLDFNSLSETSDSVEDIYNAESEFDLNDNNNYEDEFNGIQM
ncbi:unnamed protein product [Orchesella dallaii]|uniref:Uncharacterized protein n=1 Tax=Orchesella dallaii TaxID=48710 RepID=A0ABP1QUA6_9HEXA